MDGLCECGCGGKTKIAYRTAYERGWVKGEPIRFIHGHHMKQDNHWQWKGGRSLDGQGHSTISMPNHPNSHNGYVPEHRLISERILGRILKSTEVVHHYGEHNDNARLVVCESQGYHALLHARARALSESGHANYRKCKFCKQYDDPINLMVNDRSSQHRGCRNLYQKERRHNAAV